MKRRLIFPVLAFRDSEPNADVYKRQVRDLKCSGGICMTASHNPAPYNGYKAYGPDGCQITSEAADAISKAIEYDLEQERQFDYSKVDPNGLVNHISQFVSGLYTPIRRPVGRSAACAVQECLPAARRLRLPASP